jgi:hypothetical protein
MIAGAAFSAYGAIRAASAEKAAANYQRQVADNNATASRQAAVADERRQRMLASKQLGQMRANYAASGLSMDGSPEDVLADSATNAELDVLIIRSNGENRARGYQSDSNLSRMRGDSAAESGYLSAAGTLLGGAAKTYDHYQSLNRV